MATYNPSTGQWEEDEEEVSSTFNSGTTAFGVGGMPSSSGTSMAPSFSDPGFFNQPQMPSGYNWDDSSYTKSYKSPWDTSFDYMDSSGKSVGKGYDSYQDAIKKLAFTSGVKQYDFKSMQDALYNWGIDTPDLQGGYGHSLFFTPETNQMGSESGGYSPEQRGELFASQQALWDYMNSDPASLERLTYDSNEKYGRPLLEGQLQNMYANYAAGTLKGAVPDWDYHRTAYEGAYNPVAGIGLTGDKALVGTQAFFGPDGVMGYRANLDPEHYNFADTSGRVQSSSNGATVFNPGLKDYARALDGNDAFINAGDADKFGYRSYGSSTYEKAPTMASQLGEMFTKAFIGAVAGGAAGFGPLAAGESAVGAAGGAEAAGLWDGASMGYGLGEFGAGAFYPGATGYGLGETLGSLFDPSTMGYGMGDFGTSGSLTDAGTSSLSNFAPEIMGPPPASEMEGLFIDDFGGGTNAMGEFTNGKGMLSPQDRVASAMRQLGLERETAANLTQGGSKMYNFMTQSPGKAGMFKAPSPLEMLYKGGKGFMDYRSNQDAMKMYKDQLDKVSSYSDPNRARGDTANQLWQQNFQDPMAGYKDFMVGGGRDFIDQARAQAAKSGKRGSYINSGKMNSDLASMYMKQQIARGDALARGFANSPNNADNTMKYMSPMMDMERNKYAPFGQAIDSIMRGFQLSDLFGG